MGKYGHYENKSSFTQRRRDLRKHQTKAEYELWKYLKKQQMGVKFRRQHSIEKYIVDFYCHELRLIIELDGWVHGEEGQKEKDAYRQNVLEQKGYSVVRYTNEQIKYNIRGVVQDIDNTIRSTKKRLSS